LCGGKLYFKVCQRVGHKGSFGRTDNELCEFELIIDWFCVGVENCEGKISCLVDWTEAEIVGF